MPQPVSIELNKTDLEKNIRVLEKDQKMIDLPLFSNLKTRVEDYISVHPDLIVENIRLEPHDDPEKEELVKVVVTFKKIF